MSLAPAWLRHASRTDVGRKRDHNEDAFGLFPERGVYVVADGMGGGEAGEVASHMAVKAVKDALDSGQDEAGVDNLVVKSRLLRRAANQACRSIRAYVNQRGYQRSGSTFASLVFDPNQPRKAMALHAGDSRVYRVRKGRIEPVTRDHSVAAAAGLERESNIPDFIKGVITRAVGILDSVELEETPVEVKPGDVFLLCSDGLSNMVDDEDMARLLKPGREASLESVANALVDQANEAGGKDNITVVLVEVGEDPVFDQPDAALTIPPDPQPEEADGPDTSPTGKSGEGSTGSTAGTASADFRLERDAPTQPTSMASPAAPSPAMAAQAQKMTFADLARLADEPVAAPGTKGLPLKVWLLIAGALLAVLAVLLALPGRSGKSAPAVPPKAASGKTTTAPPPAVPAPPVPEPSAGPGPEAAPATPPVPATKPDPASATPPASPVKPADAPADSGLAAALATMKELRQLEPPAPAPTQAVATVTMPKPDPTPAKPPEPPEPPKPPKPAKPTRVDVEAAIRAAETNGAWGVVVDVLASAGDEVRGEWPPARRQAVDAWITVWTDARQQGDLTQLFDQVINLDDEWREFLPAHAGAPLPTVTELNASSYCQVLRAFSLNLPVRAKEARPVWDAVLRAFGRAGGQSLGHFRTFEGRSFAGETLTALEKEWAALAAGPERLRQAAEHAPELPAPAELIKGLSELRLRERTLLAVNSASAIVKHIGTKGVAVVQQHKNVLIGHGLDQSPGMGMLDEIGECASALTQAAKGATVDVAWLGQHAQKLARLLEAIDRFVKWQADQPQFKAP